MIFAAYRSLISPQRAGFLYRQSRDGYHCTIDLSRSLRANGDTAHAGNALLPIRRLRRLRINGLYRTLLRTKAAFCAGGACFWHKRRAASLFIGPVFGNRWFFQITALELCLNLLRKFGELATVRAVWPPGGILMHDCGHRCLAEMRIRPICPCERFNNLFHYAKGYSYGMGTQKTRPGKRPGCL